ncbi:M20/M25/M40 family metallo-hydrolase [Nonomuraea thailandensis]
MTPDQIESAVAAAMPQAVEELKRLAAIPSVAFPGHPEEPVFAAAAMTEELLRSTGLPRVQQVAVEGSFPAVFGEAPAPPGMPTVLLYAHYDVQPAGDPATWRTPPFEPTLIDGRLYGRGTADDKSGIISHVTALRTFQGRFPVGIKVIIEGQEEYAGDRLEAFVERNPDLLRADAIVVADTGNPRVGDPSVTTSLRGMAAFTIEVRTLKEALHSGSFGGAAPDALAALMRMLTSLHDDNGDIRVPGLPRGSFLGQGPSEEEFRRTAGVLDGVSLVGSGSLADRLWSSFAITVTGLDVPTVSGAVNAVQPTARARVTVRVPRPATPRRRSTRSWSSYARWRRGACRWRSATSRSAPATRPTRAARPAPPSTAPWSAPSAARRATSAPAARSRWSTRCSGSSPRPRSCCSGRRTRRRRSTRRTSV